MGHFQLEEQFKLLETKCSGKFLWEGPDNNCLLYKEGQVWSGDVKTMRGGIETRRKDSEVDGGGGGGIGKYKIVMMRKTGGGIPVVSL